MSPLGLAFGVLNPSDVVDLAKKYTAYTTTPAAALVPTHGLSGGLAGLGQTAPPAPTGSGAAAGAVLGVLAGIVVVLLVVRGAMGWYIGKQFGRPKSGAVVGAVFGAPGMGVLSLFPDR